MKLILATLMALVLCASTSAGNKKEAPVYDQTGTVIYEVNHADYTTSMTVNGQTYYAGCNVNDTDISCSDSPGTIQIKLADGRKVFRPVGMFDFDADNYVSTPIPIGNDVEFKYRIAHIKPRSSSFMREGDFLCVPYTNYKGKPAEACDTMTFVPLFQPMTYNQGDIDKGVNLYGLTPQQAEDILKKNGLFRETPRLQKPSDAK